MRIRLATLALCILLNAGSAAQMAGRIAAATELRPSMGEAAPIATIPAGADVTVDICFSAGKWCAVRFDGQTGFVAGKAILVDVGGKAVPVSEVEAARWSAATSSSPRAIIDDSTDIVAWGDSLTAGAGAGKGESYTEQAQAMLGGIRLIANEGVGGQSSTSIAARMDAVPVLLTLSGDSIPASGAVAVVERSALPVTNQGASSIDGTLCGVAGALALSAKAAAKDPVPSYVFTRATSGSETACTAGSRFVAADAVAYRNRVAWLWLGRNGADKGHTIEDDIAAAVKSIGHERYLVGSIIASRLDQGGPAQRIFDTNAALERQYGKRYVDVLGALVAAANDSPEDQADAKAGLVPPSLLSDAVHLNSRGYQIVARAFVDAMEANGL